MDDVASQIEQMLRERIAGGPQMINDQRSALQSAAQQDQGSIDQLRGIYTDPSNFNRSKLGAFGLGLMAPTSSGNFSESMYNGLAAATQVQNFNQEQNLSRMEKLAKLQALEATLTRQKAQDQKSIYDTQTGYLTNSLQDQGTLSDFGLQDQQLGSRPLAQGEQGPVAPDQSVEAQAELVYNDYMRNPAKYQGPQGQAVVKNAVDILNNVRTNNTRMMVAQQRQQPRPRQITSADKKIIDDATTENSDLKANLVNLQRAYEIGPKTWSGPFADTGSRFFNWWNGDEGAKNSYADETVEYNQIMQGEAIKQMAEQLKGATTDREMQKFIDIVADPTQPWTTKKPAIERVMRFIKSRIDVNDERITGVRDGSYWTGVPADQSQPQPGFDDFDVGDDELVNLPDNTVIEGDDGQRYIIRGGHKYPVGN